MVLSSSDFIVCILFTAAYVGILVAWGINWYFHRAQRGIGLHRLIGAALLIQLLVFLLLVIYFGILLHNSFTLSLYESFSVVLVVLESVASGILDCLLILIAKGWCIVDNKLSVRYQFNLSAFIITFVILQILDVLFDSFFLISLAVLFLYIGFLVHVFRTLGDNIRMLRSMVHSDGRTNNIPMQEYPQVVRVQQAQAQPPPQAQGNSYTYPPSQPVAYPPQGYPQSQPNGGYPPSADLSQGYPPQGYPQSQPTAYPPPSDPSQPYPPQGYPPQTSPPAGYPQSTEYKSPPSPPMYGASSPPPPQSYQPQPVYPPSSPQMYDTSTTPPQNYTQFGTPVIPGTPVAPVLQESIPEASEKLKLFVVFHKLMIAYIVISVILSLGPDLVGELVLLAYLNFFLVLLFLSGICVVFRLRSANRYFYLDVSDY